MSKRGALKSKAPKGAVSEWITYLPGAGDPRTVEWGGVLFSANVPKLIQGHYKGTSGAPKKERQRAMANLSDKARKTKFFRVGSVDPAKDSVAVAEGDTAHLSAKPTEGMVFGDALNTLHYAVAALPGGPAQYRSALVASRDSVIDLINSVHRAFSETSDLPPLENEREQYALALQYIALFFSKFREPSARRFFELSMTISDLNLGIHGTLLKPSTVEHRPPAASQLWCAKVRVVLCLEALILSGLTQKNAADKIADFPALQKLVSPKRNKDRVVKIVLSKTIIGWRKKLASDLAAAVAAANGEPPIARAHRRRENWQVTPFYKVGKDEVERLAKHSKRQLGDFANAQLNAAVEFCGGLSPPT